MMTSSSSLVSVIMPAFNAERYIADAIRSVLDQSHVELELLVVNDGSSDNTATIVRSFSDQRLRYFEQTNGGVSVARNKGLDECRGAFVCFLDSDDVMPSHAIKARLDVFLPRQAGAQDPGLSFVDGAVRYCDVDLRPTDRVYLPTFTGEPFHRLCLFDRACFFGNTWMIRREAIGTHRFEPGLTHGEDLLFYLEIAPGERYGFTTEEILHYRHVTSSAMRSLRGLEHGYTRLLRWMEEHSSLVDANTRAQASRLAKRIMFGSYWHAGQRMSAVRSLFGLRG